MIKQNHSYYQPHAPGIRSPKKQNLIRCACRLAAVTGFLIGASAFAASSATFVLTNGDASAQLTLVPANVVTALHFGNDNTTYTLQGVDSVDKAGRPNNTCFSVTGFVPGFERDYFHPGVPTLAWHHPVIRR